MTTIGFIGFGEVAARFAPALMASGAKVAAYDVLLDRPGGAEALASRVTGEAPRFLPLAEVARSSDVLLSTVTTDVALEAARTCARHLEPRHMFVDLNAASPGTKIEIGRLVRETGAHFVEGAILPAVGVMGAKSLVLVCGERAPEMAATLTDLGLNFRAFGPDIGKASSFKMLRSVFSKGIEALLVECLLAARRAGVEADIWREIVATLDAASFEQVGGNWVRTHATAHARRYHEMVEVEALLRELGLEPSMTAATVAVFGRSNRARLKDRFASPPATPAEVIAALDERLAEPAPQQS